MFFQSQTPLLAKAKCLDLINLQKNQLKRNRETRHILKSLHVKIGMKNEKLRIFFCYYPKVGKFLVYLNWSSIHKQKKNVVTDDWPYSRIFQSIDAQNFRVWRFLNILWPTVQFHQVVIGQRHRWCCLTSILSYQSELNFLIRHMEFWLDDEYAEIGNWKIN